MTREDIIRMARKAKLLPQWLELCPKDEKALVRFAALVAAAEREACAKVCEGGSFLHDDAQDARFGKACAAAIRARTP